jgi:LacI family transcriptional regulator
MSVTIKDIAKIAGVSHSTVSRSLNDSPLISTETKQRIQQIAKELGFEFNANARGLSIRKTGTIGLIYPEAFEDFNVNLFFSPLHNHIRRTLEREALDLIVGFPKNRFTGESNIQKLINRKKVDGLIIVHSKVDYYDLNYIKSSRIPFVFLHQKPAHIDDEVDFFCTDHFKGGYLATDHLLKLGCRNIICLSADGEEFEMRTEGYKAALNDAAIPFNDSLVLKGDCSFDSGYKAIKQTSGILKKIDGIFAQSDLMALGAIQALQQLNIKVPQDIAVVGYDDIELGTYFSPKLTTVHQPREEIATLACERLIELLSDKAKKRKAKKIVQPTLVIRESCGYGQ